MTPIKKVSLVKPNFKSLYQKDEKGNLVKGSGTMRNGTIGGVVGTQMANNQSPNNMVMKNSYSFQKTVPT
jgi:hypothetical protein